MGGSSRMAHTSGSMTPAPGGAWGAEGGRWLFAQPLWAFGQDTPLSGSSVPSDQGSSRAGAIWRQLCLGLAHSRASLSARPLDSSVSCWTLSNPRAPVAGHPRKWRHHPPRCLGSNLSPASLTATSEPLVSFHLPAHLQVSPLLTSCSAPTPRVCSLPWTHQHSGGYTQRTPDL